MKRFLIPILIFTILICGCESVKTYYVEKEKISAEYSEHPDEVVRIIGIFLKSGGYLDVRNKNARMILKGESQGVNYAGQDLKRDHIALDSISVLKIEVAHNNYWVPVVIIGVGIVVFYILLLIAFSSLKHINITGG